VVQGTGRERRVLFIHKYIAIMSQNLLHVHLFIGPIAETLEDKGAKLMAMCDRGAGLNLGSLYHASCYKTDQSPVKSYFTFTEEGFDPITLEVSRDKANKVV
jgi:hypothetical protein